ncbi:response regulator [Parasedimentitalea marina]|uniref:Sensory/regulatory protein RpfC n=1 Tax=Parasedimentitalea marina TaxID=2483033 RepID=A0A3T0MZY8_9RHOB|nr:response regulator [Parasedimentitalea marina]AZV77333.1 response regulator [Parasedimentitalea marina]
MALNFRLSTLLGVIRMRTYLPTVVTFAAVLVAVVVAEKQNTIIHNQSLRAQVQNEAGLIASRLKGRINADIQLVQGLVAVMSTEPEMDQARFSQLAEQVFGDHKEIRLVAAAPDLVVSLIYPMKGNEAVLGLDYNKNAAQREAAFRVRDSGEMVLAGPVNLIQGGRGFIGRFPLFAGTGPDRRFFGILSAVIDVDALYADTGLTAPETAIELALVGRDGMGAEGGQFYGDSHILEDTPVLVDISFPAGSWQLAARPSEGWSVQPKNLWSLRLTLLVAGALILFPTFLAERLSAARRSAISNLKQSEAELAAQTRRLQIAVQTSQVGIWEYDVESGETVWDQQLRDLYRLPNDFGAIGSTTWQQHLHPDDRKATIEKFDKEIQGGGDLAADFRIVLPDGTIHHIRSAGRRYTDAGGQPKIIGVNWDVSQDVLLRDELLHANKALQHTNGQMHKGQLALEQAHAELQEQQAELHRLSLVAKHASDSIILTDAETRILWVNDAFTKITGFSPEEAIGSTPGDLLNGIKSDSSVFDNISDRLVLGEQISTEILNYTKSGEEIWMNSNLVPVLDDNGKIELIIGIEREITDFKNRQRELAVAKLAAEQADRVKSEFLANMSHEIRTPMNGIIGMASLLAESDLTEDEKLYVDTIQESAGALLKIINDILDLSRLEAERLEIVAADFNLHHCVKSAVNLLRPKADEKGIALTVNYAEGLIKEVRGDDGRLRQILVNLIGNAVKFTEKGGVTIFIGAHSADPYRLLIRIEDSGIGISPEQSQYIFDRFSQADTAITRAFGGTGLGLTISSVLAKRMGGGISMHSELGMGSCFDLCVQMSPATASEIDTDPSNKTSSVMLAESLILMADDNKVNRLLVNKYLIGQPIELVEVVNGREAVNQCKARTPDIVLMDMSMPELDGIAATREIRELNIVQPTIVALTANAFESDRKACMAAGMDQFLSKPISKTDLLDTLATLLAARQKNVSLSTADVAKEPLASGAVE